MEADDFISPALVSERRRQYTPLIILQRPILSVPSVYLRAWPFVYEPFVKQQKTTARECVLHPPRRPSPVGARTLLSTSVPFPSMETHSSKEHHPIGRRPWVREDTAQRDVPTEGKQSTLLQSQLRTHLSAINFGGEVPRRSVSCDKLQAFNFC